MQSSSAAILGRFQSSHAVTVNLSIRPAFLDLLAALGHPQDHLPPVIHVAGTNGKGSTCAFLRAIIEACGKTAHVYTSPHLVHFHERIRVAGSLIEEETLARILSEVEQKAERGAISVFEAGTAAALTAFARTPADITLLEVGMGGKLDATNVVDDKIATVITRLSYDHREFLGNTIEKIALEKAGIIRRRTPCFVAPQPLTEAMQMLREEATIMDAPLAVGGEDWRIEAVDDNTFRFLGQDRKIENLPRPALIGTHQLWNAGLAIATTSALPFPVSDDAIRAAMRTVEWPGRLQRLTQGILTEKLTDGWELWLDGGHNDSAADVLAAQMRRWQAQDGKPIHLVYAMLSTKKPDEFLSPLKPFVQTIHTLVVHGEVPGIEAEALAEQAKSLGFTCVTPCKDVASALENLANTTTGPARILVCGSLYLVGKALQENVRR